MSFLIVFTPEQSEHKNVYFQTVLISTPVINKAETSRLIAHSGTTWTIKLYFTWEVFWDLAIQFQENVLCRSFLLSLSSLSLQFSLFYSSCFCPVPLSLVLSLPLLFFLSCPFSLVCTCSPIPGARWLSSIPWETEACLREMESLQNLQNHQRQ